MSTDSEGYEEIGLEDLKHLKIKDDALYWKGKKLATTFELRLTWAQKVIGSILSLLVGAAAIASPLIEYLGNLDNICKNTRNSVILLCPQTMDTPEASSGGQATPATPPASPSALQETP